MLHEKALAGSAPPPLLNPRPEYWMTSPAWNRLPSAGVRISAVGGEPTVMLMELESAVVAPSDTWRSAVYIPVVLYVCEGFAAVDVVLSPKLQRYVRGCPSGSNDPALEKATFKGAGPDVGFPLAEATGGRLFERRRMSAA